MKMKQITGFLIGLLTGAYLLSGIAHAQPSPVQPWRVNGVTVYYDNGGVTMSSNVTGGDKGVGTINVNGNYYRNGAIISTVVNGVNCAIGDVCTITAVAASVQVGTTSILLGTDKALFYNNAGTLGNVAPANNGVLITSAAGVPSISSTIPSATQDNITRTGTLVSGATGSGFTLALGSSTITGTLGYANGGCNATTQVLCRDNIFPTPTRAGDIAYWNGSAWVTLAGNNSGTQILQQNSSGVPSWATVVGTGTVTNVAMTVPSILSVSGSPITNTGTFAVTLANQNANLVFAGPGSGAAAAPTFRSLVNLDFPSGFVVAGTGLTGGSLAGGGTVAIDKATSSDYYVGTSNKVVTTDIIYPSETTTTYGTTTTFNFQTFINTIVTLTGNITTMSLANVIAGKSGTIRFQQSGAGSFTTVWNSILKFPGGVTPSLTTGSTTAIDVLTYNCVTATYCQASLAKDVK